MGDQLHLERFIWFEQQARQERFPNAFKLAAQFETSTRVAQRPVGRQLTGPGQTRGRLHFPPEDHNIQNHNR